MRRLLASDLGIWPSIKHQEYASDLMVGSADYWSRVADYLLLYDQIVIPTGNLQVLSVLRFMLGDDIVRELLETQVVILSRFDQWFGYIGTGGVIFFKVGDNPDVPRLWPNLATSHFLPLDQAVDAAFIALNPPSSAETRESLKKLLLAKVQQLDTKPLLTGVRDEAYRDIEDSPYLQAMLALRNSDRDIQNLKGSAPNQVTVFNPHVPPEKGDPREIRAVLQVVFENFLLGLGGQAQVNALTGDAASLSVLQAKGQRLGFAPQGRAAFAQVQSVAGVPNIGAAFAAKQISARQLLDLRQSKHAQSFRDWLAGGSPAESAQETVRRYVEQVGKPGVIESLPVKALRFAVSTGWAALEPITGAVAAAADTFLLSKWYPWRSPLLFMRQAKTVLANTPVIRAPQTKGRDRNASCSCGSGKKYKHCCGRLS